MGVAGAQAASRDNARASAEAEQRAATATAALAAIKATSEERMLSAGVTCVKTGRNGKQYTRHMRWSNATGQLEWASKVDGAWTAVKTKGATAVMEKGVLTLTTPER